MIIDKAGAYMIGDLLISIVAGVASVVAFTVLRMPFSVPLAFVVALFDLIPVIGATLGAIAGVLVTLFATFGVKPSATAVLLASLIGATALGFGGRPDGEPSRQSAVSGWSHVSRSGPGPAAHSHIQMRRMLRVMVRIGPVQAQAALHRR